MFEFHSFPFGSSLVITHGLLKLLLASGGTQEADERDRLMNLLW